jgi:hypothetical protein
MTKTNHYLKALAALVTLATLVTLLTLAMIAASASPGEAKKKGPTFPRVAFQKTNDSNINSADGTAATTTINAPTPGFLVINASSNVFNAQQFDGKVECLIEVDNVVDAPSRRFMQLGFASPATGVSNQEEDCSTNTVVPVNKGNHKVDLEALDVGTGTNFDQTTLSAVFVPFDGNGALPTK